MKRDFLIIVSLLILLYNAGKAQQQWAIITAAYIEGNDTIPVIRLPELVVYAPMIFKNAAEERRFNRLVRNVKVVYPYARLAGIKMREYEQVLTTLGTEKEKREAMKKAEDDLRNEFEGDLRNFTVSQGWILLKLIDRETGNTSYEVVSEFRGKFRAFFWQSFARIFGFNLKMHYDPEANDRDIERIVRMIESGAI
ncbi:MAG: DUF4294 domain-containing protein [Bacteroidales bacterium]|nr:DUF4294 domain-containing protein [Bacteroidales bacterium]MDZ4203890.1 DUF4294 domain-containing protein [Bacteroidales bacterium]